MNMMLKKAEISLPVLMMVEPGQLRSPELKAEMLDHLHTEGAVLLRGTGIHGEALFETFVRSFGSDLLKYEFCSTPRTEIAHGVYTSTEYPPNQSIPLHNENAYTRSWPRYLWFHCVTPAQQGGQTPIADSRRIFARIDPVIRQRFDDKQLKYVRNYDGMYDLPWQKVFGTTEKKTVEDFCQREHMDVTWKTDGTLRTSQICQATAVHPVTGEPVWFNQAHLFHASCMGREMKAAMLDVFGGAQNLPRNVFYGDDSEIEDSILDEIRGVLAEHETVFDWQKGDVLVVDNMLVAHGRKPFGGKRKVVVAMTGACHA